MRNVCLTWGRHAPSRTLITHRRPAHRGSPGASTRAPQHSGPHPPNSTVAPYERLGRNAKFLTNGFRRLDDRAGLLTGRAPRCGQGPAYSLVLPAILRLPTGNTHGLPCLIAARDPVLNAPDLVITAAALAKKCRPVHALSGKEGCRRRDRGDEDGVGAIVRALPR